MFFANVFQDLGDLIKMLFVTLVGWLMNKFVWIMGWVVTLIGSTFGSLRVLGDWMLQNMLDWSAEFMPGVDLAPWQDYLAKVNYVFPLSEFVTLGGLYMSLWALVTTYRMYKSWIPTESS